MGEQDRPRHQKMAATAARQHGVIAVWQLKRLGYTRNAIDGLARQGHLHRIYRGVYAVGHRRLTQRARWTAAVLACGPHAALSHRSAVALWEIRPAVAGPVDVTVPGRTRRGQKGIRIHSVRRLAEEDRINYDGIPVTSVHRTLLDYAEVARRQQLRLAIEAADRRELFDLRAMDACLARNPGRHGQKPLKATLAELRGPAPWTRSELERRFLALIREAGLPEPQVNVLVAGELVDCFWPEHGVVVELDSWEFHKGRVQFENDRARDIKLQLAGCRVFRVTQPRIEFEARKLLADLVAMLGQGPGDWPVRAAS